MKNILLILGCLLGFNITAQMAEPNETWQAYTTVDDVTIEYKSLDTIVKNREMNIIIFKFSNSSSLAKQINFNREIYRDNSCTNCNDSYQEDNIQSVILAANQTVSGESTLLDDKALYLFNQFKVKVPGMVAKPISNFAIIDLQITSY